MFTVRSLAVAFHTDAVSSVLYYFVAPGPFSFLDRHSRNAIPGDIAKTANPIGINPPCNKLYSAPMLSQERPITKCPKLSLNASVNPSQRSPTRKQSPPFRIFIHGAQRYTKNKNSKLPVNTPICPDRKSPTWGAKNPSYSPMLKLNAHHQQPHRRCFPT